MTIEKAQHALRRAQFFLLGLANEFLFTAKNLSELCGADGL